MTYPATRPALAVGGVLRSFRTDEFRELARRAVAQGWTAYQRGNGHVALVAPTGAQVTLSATAYTGHGLVESKRLELARAGLDLRSKAERRRAHRQEVRMHAPDTTPTPTPTRRHPTPAGGKFAQVPGSLAVLDLDGFRVRLWSRADGTWVTETRDLAMKRRLRAVYAQDRDTAVERMRLEIAAKPPIVEEPPKPPPAPVPERVQVTDRLVAPGPLQDPPVASAVARRGGFHVVQAEAGDFPLAAALEALDATLAPALAALTAAGKVDAADLIRAELDRSPLEEELVRLYRRVMTGD